MVENNGRGTTIYDVEIQDSRRPANGWAKSRENRAESQDKVTPTSDDTKRDAKLWSLAARILDRIFLRIFFIVNVAVLLAILLISVQK